MRTHVAVVEVCGHIVVVVVCGHISKYTGEILAEEGESRIGDVCGHQ